LVRAAATVDVHEVSQGGSTALDGRSQHIDDRLGDAVPCRSTETTTAHEWVETGHEQGFDGVDITDAGDSALIQEAVSQRTSTAAKSCFERGAVETGLEWFRTELVEGMFGLKSVPRPNFDPTEATRVDKAKFATIGHADGDVRVRFTRHVVADDNTAAGHPEMEKHRHRTIGCTQYPQQVLSATLET